MKKEITVGLLTITVLLVGCDFQRSRVVPDVTNTTVDVARAIAERNRLLLVVTDEVESDDIAKGLICKQSPLPGSVLRSGSMLTVLMSKGTTKVEVPDLNGFSVGDARVELFGLQLKVGAIDSEYSNEAEAGRVVATDPEAGSKTEKKSVIDIIVSRGPEPTPEPEVKKESPTASEPPAQREVEAEAVPETETALEADAEVSVPNLTGAGLVRAKALVEAAGLATGSVTYQVTGNFYAGTVMAQKPAPGTKVEKGSRVNIVVASERSDCSPCPK